MTDDAKAPADPADAAGSDVPARPGLPDRVWIPMLGAALAGLLLAVGWSTLFP